MASAIQFGERSLDLGGVTHVMGVINVSPDSKNIHTVASSVEEALAMADDYRRWGASLIDLGGQSSHFDNETIAAEAEISRVVPVIEALVAEEHIVAIDTWKAGVASAALESGAHIVNDTGGLADPAMRSAILEFGAAAILVHIEASNPHEVGEVEIRSDKAAATAVAFAGRIRELEGEGISNLILDPGIALNYRGNYEDYTRMQLEVIADSDRIQSLGKPLLIPVPRKRDFHRMVAYIALALEHKADMIRVHDVAVACDVARLFGRGRSIGPG
ncbi:MAG TPA: dihydropteroate synthase [Acidimicrobiia bacterium]